MYFNLAMELSDNVFAWYLCGILTSCSENGYECPDPEAEALTYLEIFHADALAEKQEADANNATPELELS